MHFKNLFKEINYILNEGNIINKYKEIINIYAKKRNEMTIIYKFSYEKDKERRIFGKTFVKNNKGKCYLLINNKKYDLCEYFTFNKKVRKEKIKIRLIESKTIENKSRMFCLCSSLSSLPDISKWNIVNVNNMEYMFCGCKSLLSLPDISNWNISNAYNISCMFRACDSLLSLPDISKWNTTNTKDISGIFSYCKSLSSLPDISK